MGVKGTDEGFGQSPSGDKARLTRPEPSGAGFTPGNVFERTFVACSGHRMFGGDCYCSVSDLLQSAVCTRIDEPQENGNTSCQSGSAAIVQQNIMQEQVDMRLMKGNARAFHRRSEPVPVWLSELQLCQWLNLHGWVAK